MGKNKNKNKKGPAQPKPSVEQKDLDNEPKIVELSDEEEEKPVKTDKAPPKPTDKQDKVTKKDTDNTVKENKVNNKETDNVVKIVKEDKPIDKKEKITNQKQDTKEDNSDEKEPVKDKKTDDAKTSAHDNNDKAKPAPQGDCVVCDKLAKSFCSVCKHVFYCTREHQRQHWSTHKEDCKTLSKLPYRVSCPLTFVRIVQILTTVIVLGWKERPDGQILGCQHWHPTRTADLQWAPNDNWTQAIVQASLPGMPHRAKGQEKHLQLFQVST